MKALVKNWLAAALAAVLALPSVAQEYTYSLPSTTLMLEVEAVRTTVFAGPYCGFAQELLGLTVPQEDAVETRVTALTLTSALEADPSARYTVVLKEGEEALLHLSTQGLVAFGSPETAAVASWRFAPPATVDFSGYGLTSTTTTRKETTYRTVQTDTSLTRIPVQQEVKVQKSIRQRAEEAAKIILDVRRERFNISTGNTDAVFSGEALGAALAELSRIEKEYLTLFAGTSCSEPLKACYEATPAISSSSSRYPVFRLSDEEGLLPASARDGRLWYLELVMSSDAEEADEDAPRKGRYIRYREPAICTVRVTDGQDPVLVTRVPICQLGRTCFWPLNK